MIRNIHYLDQKQSTNYMYKSYEGVLQAVWKNLNVVNYYILIILGRGIPRTKTTELRTYLFVNTILKYNLIRYSTSVIGRMATWLLLHVFLKGNPDLKKNMDLVWYIFVSDFKNAPDCLVFINFNKLISLVGRHCWFVTMYPG